MSVLRCIVPDDYRREAKIILNKLDTLRWKPMSEDDIIEYLTKYLMKFQTDIQKYEHEIDGTHGYGR